MPGFDGTGPRGMGPMTGWGRGYCLVDAGRGEGLQGWIPGRGGGMRGWRRRYYAAGTPVRARGWYGPPAFRAYEGPEAGRDQEAVLLKEEISYLKKALQEAEDRLGELENGKK